MIELLKSIPYPILIVITVLMLLAPLHPMPHVLEKLIMLKNGTLKRPLDIFDLCMHLTPLILLISKWYVSRP